MKEPPEGWWCYRREGHEGPCAARPNNGSHAPNPESPKNLKKRKPKQEDYEPGIVIFVHRSLAKQLRGLVKEVFYDWPVAGLQEALKAKTGRKR